MEVGRNYFGVTDYILLGVTLLISLLIGFYYGYKSKNTNEELLVGGRNMSIFPVATSVMVTYVSAITILGVPSEVYGNGSQIFVHHVVSAVGITLSAFVIMPFFYRMKLTSINEYLERRFDSKCIRWLASSMFILQQVTLNGVILYAPSIAMEAFLGVPMWMSVLGIGVCATIYTNIGGLKAVVWTDAFQFLMMISGMLVIVWKGISASGGFKTALQLASEGQRLQVLDFKFDPFTRHNFWNFLIGSGFHSFMQPGIHQLQVQRYSGMSTCSKAKQVIAYSAPLKLVIMSLCMVTGLAIFAFYAHCDPLTKGNIQKVDQIVTYFVVHELAEIPGMMGIFTSCIFSAVLSSLSSSLNSLAAVTWEDFLSRHKYFRSMSPRAQTNVSRACGVIFGIICMGLAFSAQNLGTIFTATFAVIGATAGTLYGVFLMAMFMPCVNAVGAFVGMLAGFVAIASVSVVSLFFKKRPKAYLSLSIDGCPVVDRETYSNSTTPVYQDDQTTYSEWPDKIFQLSYLLYAISAAIISILVGILVSLIASTFSSYYRNKKPSSSCIHPFVRPIFSSSFVPESCHENSHRNEKKRLAESKNHQSLLERKEKEYSISDGGHAGSNVNKNGYSLVNGNEESLAMQQLRSEH